MTMTVEEYSAGVDQLERKLARIAELRAMIAARNGQMTAEQAGQFVFNDIAPKADVTSVADVNMPTFDEGASKPAQELGYQGKAEIADADPTTIGQDESIEGIFSQVNAELARGQGGTAPASSTQTRVADPLAQIAPPAEAQLTPGGDKPLMQSIDESIQAGGAALAQSATMGAITLSEKDKKRIEQSPIAAAIGSLIGEAPGIVGSLGSAKVTATGFKAILPKLVELWNSGGEEIGKVIVNAAAREGLGGAYWSTIKQFISEVKNPEEQRDWNDRLTQLATDVGMFAVPGAVVEGTMAGRAGAKVAEAIGKDTELPTNPADVPPSPKVDLAETEGGATLAPLREQPSAEQLSALQDKFKPMDKAVEEAAGKTPATNQDITKVVARAKASKPEFDKILNETAAELGFKEKPISGVKTESSVDNKIKRMAQQGKSAKPEDLGDLLRGSIIADDVTQFDQVAAALKRRAEVTNVDIAMDAPKNKFGYRGYHIDAKLSDGHVVEIQLHTKDTWEAKKFGDEIYAKWRSVSADEIEGRITEYQDDLLRSQQVFDKAWEKAAAKPQSALIDAIKRDPSSSEIGSESKKLPAVIEDETSLPVSKSNTGLPGQKPVKSKLPEREYPDNISLSSGTDLGAIKTSEPGIEITEPPISIRPKSAVDNKKVKNLPAPGKTSTMVRDVPLKEIKTDPDRFQNRASDFSEKTASAIAERYDPNLFDPIVLWRDPKNGKSYVISGHSRLEGMRRRNADVVPSRYFVGTEADAIKFGKIEGNRLGTKEDLAESVSAFKRAKSEGYTQAKLKDLFGSDVGTLEDIQHLNPKGQFMEQLSAETSAGNFPYIKRVSRWVGDLRKRYPDKLTDAHEQQMFDFFYRSEKRNYDMLKDDFEHLISKQVDTFDFDKNRALVFKRAGDVLTGTRARADTGAAERMIDDLKARQRLAKTPQEHQALQGEIDKLRRDIGNAVKSQTDMFGDIAAAVDDATPVGGAEVGTGPMKPLGQKVVETAEKLESEAKARIKKRSTETGKVFDVVGASGEAIANLADLGIIGAAKIAKGAVKFTDWSAAMVKEFGDEIKPHLEAIYKSARETFHRNRAQETVNEHLEYMKEISVTQEYRPRSFQRLKDLTRAVRDVKTAGKLGLFESRANALRRFANDELTDFVDEAWQAGVPMMKTPDGTIVPVFESKERALDLWNRAFRKAEARYKTTPRVTPQQAAAISIEARRLFAEEMVDMGVALRARRTGIKMSPDVKRKTDLSLSIILKADMGEKRFKEALAHIPENDLQGRQLELTRLAIDRGLMVPAVRAQGTFVPLDFAAYGKFKDVSGEFLDPTRMIQTIDGALSATAKAGMEGQAGPAERYILWRTRDMIKQKMNWIADMEATGKQAFAGLNKQQRRIASEVTEFISTKDVDLSVAGLLKHSEIRDLTTDPKVLEAVLKLRKIYDDVLDWQNVMREQRSQKLISKRAFYSPRKQKEAAAWQELLGMNATPENLFTTGSTIPDFVLPNKPHNPHELQRILLDPKYELEDDALKLLESYLNTAARDIFDTSIIQNAKAFIDQLEPMGFGRTAESLRDWIGQAFAGSQHGIDKRVSNALTGAFGETVGNRWQKWSGKFRGALARSVFPANFSWNLFLQTSSGVLTHTRYGTANSMKGAVKWFTDSKFREEMAENAYSYIVKTQKSGNISHQDFNQGMARAIKLEKGPLETASDAANYLSEWIERHMTGWSVATGYEDGLKKGLTGKALWEYASDAGAKTQSMYNKEDLPGLLRSNAVKTIAPFQTFGFEMWNTIQEVAGRIGTPAATKQERIKTVLRFLAGATAVNITYSSASGRKPWEAGSLIPFYSIFGAPVEAALKGESLENSSVRGLPSPVGIAAGFGKAIESAIKDGDYDKLAQWLIRYGTAGVGIPAGTQLNRIFEGIRAISNGGQVDKNGKIIFPITDTKEQIKAVFGGPYSTDAGQEKIRDLEKGVIEIAPTESPLVNKAIEGFPIVGDVIEFKKPKEEGIEIVPDVGTRPSSKRRSRPRSRR